MPECAPGRILFVIPDLYHSCLRWIGARDGLPSCIFRKEQINQIVALEEEVSRALPVQYENHLLRLGSGEEHGGIARWLHLDFTHPGNILSANRIWAERGKPAEFLAIYTIGDNSLFGYLMPKSSDEEISEEIYTYLWEDGGPQPYSPSLGHFYRERLDCSAEEILAIESGEIAV